MTANRFTTRPLYLQLRDALAERISSGSWRPGAIIPSESDLAHEFGVSPGTMRKALDLLESERVLRRRQGRGTFINDQNAKELALRFCNVIGANNEPIGKILRLGPITAGVATDAESTRLVLGEQRSVYRIHRVHLYRDRPLMVDMATVPADLFPNLLENQKSAESVTLLAHDYGILLGTAKERVSIGVAEPDHARSLEIEAGSPVMVLDRVVADLTGRAIEWRMAHCNFRNQCYLAKTS